MKKLLFCIVLLFSIISCNTSEVTKENSLYSEDENVNLYAFIGRRITVEKMEREPASADTIIGLDGKKVALQHINFDQKFKAVYKIELPLFNDLASDTISFIAFDHYGTPKFSEHEYAILYIQKSEKEDQFYHKKYIFDPVQKTDQEVWIGLKGESISDIIEKRKTTLIQNQI